MRRPMQLRIENMKCGGCAASVKKAVQLVDPDAEVHTHPERRQVEIRSLRSRAKILEALQQAGFPAYASTEGG